MLFHRKKFIRIGFIILLLLLIRIFFVNRYILNFKNKNFQFSKKIKNTTFKSKKKFQLPKFESAKESGSESNKSTKEFKNKITKFPLPPNLIILTQRRSGSSIIGSLFNVRPNITYVYEPLQPFGPYGCQKKFRNDSIAAIKSILTCHFERLTSIYRKSKRPEKNSRCKIFHMCSVHGSLKAKKISQFLSRDTDICQARENYQYCPRPIDSLRVNQFCRKSELISIKTIHFCSLEWLHPLLDDKKLNIKILHLVRDPRSTLNSRGIKTIDLNSSNTYAVKDIADLCGRILTNLEFTSNRENKQILENKFKRIRFEDFIMNPIDITKQIFDFAGIEMTSEVTDWINNATAENNAEYLHEKHRFGTIRNTKSVLYHWRNDISLSLVTYVQEKCYPVLKKLGYVFYDNIEDFRNTNISHF